MDNPTIQEHLKIAVDAAIAAGKYLAACNRDRITVNRSEGKDIKISADKESESIIIDFLKKKTEFAILSEEKGLTKAAGDSDLTWVVDPLDGSINFFRGIPVSCVSIGLCQGEKPLLGVIYDFNLGELYTGITGGGAWLNGREISVSKTTAIQKAILFTGFPANADFSPDALAKMLEQIRAYLKLRWIGSAALSLAYVAVGRGDAYIENGIRLWDIAAGIAIVAGAGGKYAMSETEKEGVYNICATNKKLPI